MTWIVRQKGWDGFAVEAAPLLYSELHTGARGVTSMEAALCEVFDVVEFMGEDGCCAGIATEMSDVHKTAFHQDAKPSYMVNCVPIGAVTKALGIKTIDYFSLDVEGAELVVLKGFDWENVHVRLVLVELNGQDEEKDEQVRQILREHEFSKHEFKSVAYPPLNEIWIHNTVKALPTRPPTSLPASRPGCDYTCKICGEGDPLQGGAPIISHKGAYVCTQYCSKAGYCGTTPAYRNGRSCTRCLEY